MRHKLRAACADQHAALDSLAGGLDLAHRPDYRRFLEASAAALLPLETALVAARVERYFPDWEARSRRSAILDDLASLGGDIRPLATPDRLDLGALLGVMYVLEGSRLGARLVVRTVQSSSDPMVAAATAYLRHGQSRPLWPSFLAVLEQHAVAVDRDDATLAGARMAFGMFSRAFALTERHHADRATGA